MQAASPLLWTHDGQLNDVEEAMVHQSGTEVLHSTITGQTRGKGTIIIKKKGIILLLFVLLIAL